VSGAVAMAHAARNHEGDGLEASVRVIWKTSDVILRVIAVKIVEHQERVEPPLQILREHAGEFNAGSVAGRHPGDDVFYRPGLLNICWRDCLIHV
jgi:hypothetical protein